MAEPRRKALQAKVASRLRERARVVAPMVAARLGPPLGNVPVSRDERRRRWWQTADDWPTDPEESRVKELALLGYDPDGLPIPDAQGNPVQGLSREDVGLLKYPYRKIDARAAAGPDDERGAARYAREMSELGPPEPEPLELAARAAAESAGAHSGPGAGATPAGLPALPLLGMPLEGGLT